MVAASKESLTPYGGTFTLHSTADLDNTPVNLDSSTGAKPMFAIGDNRLNTGEANYVKFYDSDSPTVGTTDPVMVIPCKAGTRVVVEMPKGVNAFTSAGLSIAVVTTAGTAGTTSPTSQFDAVTSQE